MDLEQKAVVHWLITWGLRAYVVTVLAVGIYSLVWLLEVAELIDRDALAIVWFAIGGMGVAFLVILVPAFWSSRSLER